MNNQELAKLPIFHGMTDHERDEALACAIRVEVNQGDHIITQGHKRQNLWFILEGKCQVTRRTKSGERLQLAELEAGTQFGEMSFFSAAPHSADVIAMTDMVLLKLPRKDYERLNKSGNPIALKLALNSLEQLAERLRRTDEWISELVTKQDHTPTPSEWTSFRDIIFR